MVKLTPGAIFAFALGIYFVAALVPAALDTLFDVNTTGWGASNIALWGLIPLAIIAAVVIVFVPRMGGKGE